MSGIEVAAAGADAAPTASGEFRRGWRVVVGAAFGAGLGLAGLLTYNMGLFAEGLTKDIGLSRTAYGAAFFGATLAMAFAMPLVGRAVDRFGARATAAAGALALAAGFVALSKVGSVAGYAVILLLIGLLAASSTPVPHTRAIAGTFQRARGLALGLTQVGIGLSAALVPPIIASHVAQNGWRSGLLMLAGLAVFAVVPIMLGLPGCTVERSHKSEAVGASLDAVAAFAKVRSSRAYKLQIAAFTAMALGFAGLLSHFVPMLREAGVSLQQAGAFAGMIGLSVIGTRVVVGWLSDRMEPAFLGAASCCLCMIGLLALAFGGPALAPVAAVALGAAMGAEADLLGIMTARNFPMAAYSRSYAQQYAAFSVAGGLSPLWIGYVADVTGGYQVAVVIAALALVVPLVLFLAVPRALRDAQITAEG